MFTKVLSAYNQSNENNNKTEENVKTHKKHKPSCCISSSNCGINNCFKFKAELVLNV